jgi:hypothetical protein
MKRRAAAVPALTFIVAAIASAQSVTQDREYWVDPSTELMWAGRDNGKDVSWSKAVKYCRNLRLANYSDWRLANNVELQGIYDKTANAPGLAGDPGKLRAVTWHVKGDLFVTGYEWANNRSKDDAGYRFYFDFNSGEWDRDPTGFPYPFAFRRALCVRGSRK